MRRPLSLLLALLLTLIGLATCATLPVFAQDCTNSADVVEQTLDPASDSMAPGAEFTVAWTVRNTGDCVWSRSYRLIFVGGDRLEGPRTLRLSAAVEPDKSLTLSLDLTAPSADGGYTGTWQLRSADGDNFGPELTVEIQVAQAQSATSEVVLPEVLTFGGMGAGPDPNALANCAVEGVLPEAPTLVVNREMLEYRLVAFLVCSLSEGSQVTVTLTAPDGNSFERRYVQGPPVTTIPDPYAEDDGNVYTGTFIEVDLAWLIQAPSGEWLVTITGDEFSDATTIEVPDPPPSIDEEAYAQVDNWPVAPADPFAASGGCHYRYLPGQAMMIEGSNLPPDITLQLGIYHVRFGSGYFADQVAVQTDEEGTFSLPYQALSEAGEYEIVSMETVDPAGFHEDGVQYDLGSSGADSSFSCFSVRLENEDELPVRLAVAAGMVGKADIQVYDYSSGVTYYPTFNAGACDASEAGWWRDGEWVLYQSNCVKDESAGYVDMKLGDNYDLYSALVDTTFARNDAENVVQLTQTPDVDESDPDANKEGVIVYRQAPAGSALDASGELWLLDSNDGSKRSLGISGRAPSWSPDGKRIAFMSDIKGSWQIYIYDVAKKKLTLVSTGCRTQCRMPAWSPDGKEIIYEVSQAADDLTPAALWIAGAGAVSRPHRFLAGPYGHQSWSSSGWIAFDGPDGVYRTMEGSQPKAELFLYSNPEWAAYWSPVWSH